MGELVRIDTQPASNVDAYRASTDAAELCKGIVVASAQMIQGRKYVKVEGWQAIAIAHNCTASARDVRRVEGGVSAVGEVRRMSDGVVIAEAEGFVGEDEPTWFGGKAGNRTLPKRADYAIRAMAQTRAISRACRSAFAHVVVMMNAGLSTTPAEEVPVGGFDDCDVRPVERPVERAEPQTERPKRQAPLQGPIKTREALRTACGALVRELHACDDTSTLDALLTTEKALVDQVRDEAEFFWKGDGADFLGLEKEIERARIRCADDQDQGDDGSWRNNVLAAG